MRKRLLFAIAYSGCEERYEASLMRDFLILVIGFYVVGSIVTALVYFTQHSGGIHSSYSLILGALANGLLWPLRLFQILF